MRVILDGPGRRSFSRPLRQICADKSADVPAALDLVRAALDDGCFVAGWLGYELGYALEPKLARFSGNGPLLRLGVFAAMDTTADVPLGRAYAGPLKLDWDFNTYAARFAQVKDFIASGDIYQANLSLRARFTFLGDAQALYERLLQACDAGYCGFVDDGERQIVSLSPELFFDLTADGIITVRPMKGTAPREQDDDAARARLAASPKNRAENLMIVDLIRNDLSRIAEPGSVTVPDLFKVETYPTLHTMVSTVTAKKRSDAGVADILKALFPCGSVTGAPKIRAMEILHDLESAPRGAYCGAVGYFAPNGEARFNVAIRTLSIQDGQGALGLGGGVVQDSQAAAEYDECLLKARFYVTARQPIALIETMRFENGFARLDAHLARMHRSAHALGLAFDAQAAQRACHDAVVGMTGPLRVRLTLDEAGLHHATAQSLPPNPDHWTYTLSPDHMPGDDALLGHKTSWRERYDAPHPGDEMIFRNQHGQLTEGSRSNIFVKRDGVLWTPPLSCGVLPGILRAELLASGQAREAVLTADDLMGEVYFGNALRGLIRAVPYT